MNIPRGLAILALVGLGLIILINQRETLDVSSVSEIEETTPREPLPLESSSNETSAAFVVSGVDPLAGRIGAGLNAATGSGKRDLQILQGILTAWRTNAPGLGNPVGNNREITAALTGQNPWGFAIIPQDHPAINEEGDLCDRWGTPLFFHQLSGERMEIWSHGPDRRRGTVDDIIVTP